MAAFIALLRAVNVGGTGKLPMSELKSMCEALGFAGVRTYIASGNVVFTSRKSEAAVKKALEAALESYAGKPVGVMVRTLAEMQAVLTDNPFPKAGAQPHHGDLPRSRRRRPIRSPAVKGRRTKQIGSAGARSTSTTATAWGNRSWSCLPQRPAPRAT